MTKTLLCQRHYPMDNHCFGRSISVGILRVNDYTFKPVIRLHGPTRRGVILDRATFDAFVSLMPKMIEYMDTTQRIEKNSSIKVNNHLKLLLVASTLEKRLIEVKQKPSIRNGLHNCRSLTMFPLNKRHLRLFERLSPCIERYMDHLEVVASVLKEYNDTIVHTIRHLYATREERDEFEIEYGTPHLRNKTDFFLRKLIIDYANFHLPPIMDLDHQVLNMSSTKNIYCELLTMHTNGLIRQILRHDDVQYLSPDEKFVDTGDSDLDDDIY